MIKNWQCLPGGGGGVEQWPLSMGEVGFLLWIWKTLSSNNNSSLLNLVFLLTLTLFNNWLSLILPLRGKLVMGSDGHPGLYCLLWKLAPQCIMGLNFKKFSHLRISGSFDGESWKRNDHWLFCMAKVGMDIVPERQCLNQIIFYFIEQRKAVVRCLRSHGKYQHQMQFCIDRKENLSAPWITLY